MLALHDAADGRLARVRVPGGGLSAAALLTPAAARGGAMSAGVEARRDD